MSCLCEQFREKRYGIDMNGMPEHPIQHVDWKSRLQIYGTLLKKSAQSKWMRRFFVVRDGWLLYYPDTEKKDIGRRHFFNIHPKAAIPLGHCVISLTREPGQAFAFVIAADEIEVKLTLAAENEYERDKWVAVLETSKRITWANHQLADNMIRELDERGLAMAKERQNYVDRLQSEVQELAGEKEKTWELEKLNEELEKEKARMESFAEEMKSEYEKIRTELSDMVGYMKSLDTERTELWQQLNSQETDLQALATEKESIEAMLKRQESVTEQLSQEKQQTEHDMRGKLEQIEQQTQHLLQEKAEAEMRLHENKERTQELEEEKEMYNEQAQELQSTIKDLTIQKEMTEAELKEEVLARMTAEKRLKDAETSLNNLGQAVERETPNIGSEVKEQMVVNVNKLKDFFENLAQEAKVDPDKPVVMKNAIHARKTIMRKNRTRKFERRKSSSMRAKSMVIHEPVLRMSKTINPRRAKSTFVQSSSASRCEEEDDEGELVELPTSKLQPIQSIPEYTEHF